MRCQKQLFHQRTLLKSKHLNQMAQVSGKSSYPLLSPQKQKPSDCHLKTRQLVWLTMRPQRLGNHSSRRAVYRMGLLHASIHLVLPIKHLLCQAKMHWDTTCPQNKSQSCSYISSPIRLCVSQLFPYHPSWACLEFHTQSRTHSNREWLPLPRLVEGLQH